MSARARLSVHPRPFARNAADAPKYGTTAVTRLALALRSAETMRRSSMSVSLTGGPVGCTTYTSAPLFCARSTKWLAPPHWHFHRKGRRTARSC